MACSSVPPLIPKVPLCFFWLVAIQAKCSQYIPLLRKQTIQRVVISFPFSALLGYNSHMTLVQFEVHDVLISCMYVYHKFVSMSETWESFGSLALLYFSHPSYKILSILMAFSHGEKTSSCFEAQWQRAKCQDCGAEKTWLLILVLSLSTFVNLARMANF